MVQATFIGLIAHELETIYERVIKGQLKAEPHLIQSIRLIQDDVADRIQLIREKAIDYPATHILNVLQNIDQQRPIDTSQASTALESQFTHDLSDLHEVEYIEDEIVLTNDPISEQLEIEQSDKDHQSAINDHHLFVDIDQDLNLDPVK